jgi:hypothetical protein
VVSPPVDVNGRQHQALQRVIEGHDLERAAGGGLYTEDADIALLRPLVAGGKPEARPALRVLMCGSRHWSDREAVVMAMAGIEARRTTDLLEKGNVTVIHGAARGADTIAGEVAAEWGYHVEVYPADWKRHGKAAGFIRNAQMLEQGRPHLVIAFTDDLEASRGTADMVRRARAADVPVYVIGSVA